MKANELRKLIREEVKKAVKEELQDMLNEAVKFASTPNKTGVGNSYRPITQKDIKRTWSTGPLNPGTIPLEEMLQQTATKAKKVGQQYGEQRRRTAGGRGKEGDREQD